MERRFAVHAGGNTKALSRHVRRAWLSALTVALLAGTATAKPKRHDAKVQFDRGVAAYKKGNFQGASDLLGKSFEIEPDVDTLFAWAQAERKLEHCDKASELYEKLMTYDMPAANKEAVVQKLEECRQIIAAQTPPPPAPAPAPPPPPAPAPMIAPTAPPEAPPEQPMVDTASHRSWYKDPVALGLVGAGVVGMGVGAGFLVWARSLNNQIKGADDYPAAKRFSDRSKSRGEIGLITGGAGGVLVVGGVVWIVLHRGGSEQPPVTGWLGPSGGGLAFNGAF